MSQHEGQSMASEITSAGKRLRILAADDNADLLETLSMVLDYMGHDIELASNGEEALEKMEHQRPQVVLLDVGMPVLDGYGAVARARTFAWRNEMYVIAMTGWGTEDDKQRALDAGFDMHIVKPFDTDALRTLLASLTFPREAQPE